MSDTLVLRLVFQSGSIAISKVEGHSRYVSKGRDSIKGDFLGVQVYGLGKGSVEGPLLLECPGEEAFWKRYGDIIASHKNLLPPEDAESVDRLELGRPDGSEEFNIWIRIPNFLLPIYHSLGARPDTRRDGHYSWLALNLRHRFGHPVWTLGFAAGGDTRHWLWFKDARWSATLELNKWERAPGVLGQQEEVQEGDEPADFESIARHVAIPAPFPSPTPSSFLKSACEQLLGVDAAVHLGFGDYKDPLSRLHIAWESEPLGTGEKSTVRRLVLRRVFLRTAAATDATFRRDPHAEGTPFTLMQRSRPLANIRDQAQFLARCWYLQVSRESPHRVEKSAKGRAKDTGGNYSVVLQDMFERGWEGLVKSLRADPEHGASALFGLRLTELNEKTPLSYDDSNPLPQFDLAVKKDSFRLKAPYRRGNEYLERGIGEFRVEPRPPNLVQAASSKSTLTWFALRNHRGKELKTDGEVTSKHALDFKSNPLGDSKSEFQNDSENHFVHWNLRWEVLIKCALDQDEESRIRAGSLDIVPSTAEAVTSRQVPCLFYFRHQSAFSTTWNAVAPLQLAFHAFGWKNEAELDPREKARDRIELGTNAWVLSPEGGLTIPIKKILPGEADHHEAETESLVAEGGANVSTERPLIISVGQLDRNGKDKPARRDTGASARQNGDSSRASWLLELQEIAGQTFTRQLNARIKLIDRTLATKPAAETRRDLRTLYVDRTPFFVGLFELFGITQFAPEEGDEAAYYSTKGSFRGWQLRSTQQDYLLHLPPQGVGEAMEKGKRADGYSDIEEGETVNFRFAPIATLTVSSSDWERRYGPVPWNLRLTLNELKDNRLVGLPLKAAEFEMLYGLRMKINNAPYLRVAELLARLGLPRRQLHTTPVNREYWANPDYPGRTVPPDALVTNHKTTRSQFFAPTERIYQDVCAGWKQLLDVINSRLAVYEVFDDRQIEFDPKGEPQGLILEGNAQHPILVAALRKSARLRVSMAAEPNKPGEDDSSSPALSNKQELKLLRGRTLKDRLKDKSIRRDWWASLIPNYDDGLAGSFAWAFESRLLYESLWVSDPNPDTATVVEAVEATLARLYFSALGGWSNQRAAFANGKIVVVVAVEMGRVSELRVEVIGRIGILWNKAKLVTVFRRSVLPSNQFQDQQDLHEGRPLLRKTEEYVEFLEKYRLADDTVTLREAGKLQVTEEEGRQKAGCLKASSCEEKILVDSRWGTDIYDDQGNGIGFKVPLRKAGSPAHLYGPANLLLHFHANGGDGTSEVAGRVENLEDVLFWSDVRLDKTADTNTWPPILGVDVFAASRGDEANIAPPDEVCADSDRLDKYEKDYWSAGGGSVSFQETIKWGTPPVSAESVHCTFRIAGLAKEASLNKHLIESNPDAAGQRPVGAILRNVTLSRGFQAYGQADPVGSAAAGLQASTEHLVSFLEQISTRTEEASDQAFGWEKTARNKLCSLFGVGEGEFEKLAADPKKQVEKLLDDLKPAVSVAARIDETLDELQRRADKELEHFLENTNEFRAKLKRALAIPSGETAITDISKELQNFRDTEIIAKLEIGVRQLKENLPSLDGARLTLLELKKLADGFASDIESRTPKALKGPKNELSAFIGAMNDTIESSSVAVPDKIESVKCHLEDVLRGRQALQFTNRLAEIARSMEARTNTMPSVRAGISTLANVCFTNGDSISQDILASWKRLEDGWAKAKQSDQRLTTPSAADYVAASARIVVECFAPSAKIAQEPPSTLREELRFDKPLADLADAIRKKASSMSSLLAEAAVQHGALMDVLREGLPNWVYTENGSRFEERLTNGLRLYCKDRIAAIDSSLSEVGGWTAKQINVLRQVYFALNNANLSGTQLESLKGLVGKGSSTVDLWVEEAKSTKNKAWGDLKEALARSPSSPLGRMVQHLGKLNDEFSSALHGAKPEEFSARLNRTFKDNVQHLYQRADRELRGIGDQLKKGIGVLADTPERSHQEIEAFCTKWLDGVEPPLLKRALENVSGTVEHALRSLELASLQAGKLRDELLPNLPPLPNLKESTKRQLQIALELVLGGAEEMGRQAQLPWLRGLPKKISPEQVVNQVRHLISDLELATDQTLPEVNSQLQALRNLPFLDGLSKELHDLKDPLQSQRTKLELIGSRFRADIAGRLRRLSGTSEITVEARRILLGVEDEIAKQLEGYGGRVADALGADGTKFFQTNLQDILNTALSGIGLDVQSISDDSGEALRRLKNRLPDISHLERGLAEVHDWMDGQRESLALTINEVRKVLDVRGSVGELRQASLETFRAFGQVPKVPALTFSQMADLNGLQHFEGDVKGYIDNLNGRLQHVSYSFNHAAKDVAARLRMTPVKTMVDRVRDASGEVVEEVRMRAATVETAVRNVGQKIEADARRMIDSLKPSLKDILPDFGGLKLEKLLAAAGLSEGLIKQFQQKLKIQHGLDPQTRTAFVDSRLENLILDDTLTVFSFGPVSLRLRNVKMSSHLRIEVGQGRETRRQSDGQLIADWEVLVGGNAIITYEQAALENKDGHTKMQLDPKKVRMPSILQSVADLMKSFNYKDDSGLQAGIINHLPTEITGYVKFNAAIPSAGAPTSGIQNLRISLFFELGLRFPRFPSLRDADLRISAGVGLSDKEAPFIMAIWILGGCGWFQLRLDYVVPFKDGSPRLDVNLSVGLGVSASLAFDCGFASGSVYVALAVEIECLFSNAKGQSHTKFSMVLTMAGNLNILGIISVQLLIVLTIGYSSPGPMIGTGMIRVSIKICWCFTLKVERSFTKRFSGGSGGQSAHWPKSSVPNLAESSSEPMPFFARRMVPQRDKVPVYRTSSAPHHVHRKVGRMIV